MLELILYSSLLVIVGLVVGILIGMKLMDKY